MRLFCVTVFFALVINVTCAGQDAKIKYGGMQQLGISIEANAINAMPNLINGVRFGRLFTGIGIAYEIQPNSWRGVNTMPIYADVRYYLFKKKWVFALADIGTNLLVGNEWMSSDRGTTYSKQIGLYGNIGAGVKARLGRSTFYSFDVSYNFKQTKFGSVSEDWLGRLTEESNNFKQRRILIRLGIEI